MITNTSLLRNQSKIKSEILQDLKQSGKERPWMKNKLLSLAISKAYSEVPELQKYGDSVDSCGNYLRFGSCNDSTHGKKLIDARFCKNRLCVMCQWRKSLVIRKQVFDLVSWHKERHSSDVPLLLTLTVVNVHGSELNRTIDRMNVAWKRLVQRKAIDRIAHSWFRSLEITYNEERQDFHPHFHVLLMVPRSYFDKRQDLYVPHEEWLKLWQTSLRDDRITQVDIRKIKARENGSVELLVAEVAKYATKPSTYIRKSSDGALEVSPLVLEDLHYALKGRRLIGFGGLFSQLREEKKLADVDEADLVNVEDEATHCVCKVCGSPLVEEVYKWNIEVRQYCKTDFYGFPSGP